MELYHYTFNAHKESITNNGLRNVFGLIFFTTDGEQVEPSVKHYSQTMIRVSVELTDEYEKITDLLKIDYDLICSYFNPKLIHLTGADISKWYVIRRDLKPEEIIEIKEML